MTPIDKGFESPSDPRVRDRSPHATALDFLPERLPRLPLGIGEVGQRRVADASQSGEEAKVFEHLAGSGRLGGTGARQLLRQRRHFGAGQGVASTALKRSRRRCNALTHTPCNARGALATLAVMVSSFLPRHNLSVATLRTTSTGWFFLGIHHLSLLEQPLGRDELGTHEQHVGQLKDPRIHTAGPDHEVP